MHRCPCTKQGKRIIWSACWRVQQLTSASKGNRILLLASITGPALSPRVLNASWLQNLTIDLLHTLHDSPRSKLLVSTTTMAKASTATATTKFWTVTTWSTSLQSNSRSLKSRLPQCWQTADKLICNMMFVTEVSRSTLNCIMLRNRWPAFCRAEMHTAIMQPQAPHQLRCCLSAELNCTQLLCTDALHNNL